MYKTYAKGAYKRNLEFSLSLEQFSAEIVKPCVYCGQFSVRLGQHYKRYNGLDRKDNFQGYTVYNAVSCCRTCNLAKRAMTVDEFLNWACRVVEFSGMYLRKGVRTTNGSVPRGTCCCGQPARTGQRTCLACHAGHMRAHRRKWAPQIAEMKLNTKARLAVEYSEKCVALYDC